MESFKLIYYRQMVDKAVKERKLFRLYGYTDTNKLKSELFKRGYLEVIPIATHNPLYNTKLIELAEKARSENKYEKALISKIVGERAPDFILIPGKFYVTLYPNIYQINCIKFIGSNFTSKHEICDIVNVVKDKLKNKNSAILFPRTWKILGDEDISEFLEEYNWTMLTSLIMYMANEETKYLFSTQARYSIPFEGLEWALNYITDSIDEIEAPLNDKFNFKRTLTKHQWSEIRKTWISVIKIKQTIYAGQSTAEYYAMKIKMIAEKIKQYWPERTLDGYQNVWIVKPDGWTDGEGILVSNDFTRIRQHLQIYEDYVFVVQKYLEKPMLIHDVKFHIRSYYLIRMDENNVNFYTHPSIAIKLASEIFTLETFSERRHLTNISIQKNYQNTSYLTSKKLPENHMMTLERFEQYLAEIGHPNLYQDCIFPSMKQTLALLSDGSLYEIEHKCGRFELFGVDWMIGEDFSTQLIEINRYPSLENYTVVSTIVLNDIIEDLIKVVVDNFRDATASCGGFELIFQSSNCTTDSGYSSRKNSSESNWSDRSAVVNRTELFTL